MTERLREELRRLGDAAPDLEIPHETWARGRRARTRDRVVAGLLVASLVAIAGTLLQVTPVSRLATEVLSADEPGGALGVPDRIHAIPSRLLQDWDEEIAPGVAAVAFTTERGDAFVVSASDGTYHRVSLSRLPESDRRLMKAMLNDQGSWLALSPEGRFLAYSWEQPTTLGEFTGAATGISVIDLVTGQEELVVNVTGGAGVVIDDLRWSPGGRWISWSGVQTTSWVQNRRSYGPAAYGRIDTVGGAHTSATIRQAAVDGTAIGDDGLVRLIGAPRGAVVPDWAEARPVGETTAEADGPLFAISPDGRAILAGSRFPTRGLAVLEAEGSALRTIDLPQEDYPEGALVRPLGWVDAENVVAEVVRVTGNSESGWSWSERRLVVIDAYDADALPQGVGEVDAQFDNEESIVGLTVATGLMSLDQPSVSRHEPTWPWSTERKFATAALVALGLGLAAYLLFLRRSRRLLS